MPDILDAYGCSELRPLVERGILTILPGADVNEPYKTLSLHIEPLREDSRRSGLTTYSIEVLRDADVSAEQAQQYGPGEGPNQKYTIEVDHENRGSEFVEGFDDADDAIAWIERECDRQ
jgi:hypothetical protein